MMKLRRGTSHLDIGPKVLIVLIAIVLIIGAIDALYSLICQLPMATFSIMIYPIVQIIPAILLLKYLNKPAKYLIFIFAFFMGLIDLISNILGLSGLSFSLGMLSMFLDIIFIVSAIHAFLGDKHSASRLFYDVSEVHRHVGSATHVVCATAREYEEAFVAVHAIHPFCCRLERILQRHYTHTDIVQPTTAVQHVIVAVIHQFCRWQIGGFV